MAVRKLLRLGSRGDSVKRLQAALNLKYFSLNEDGIFGKATEIAVKEFQRNSNLTVDGIVGEATLRELNLHEENFIYKSITMPANNGSLSSAADTLLDAQSLISFNVDVCLVIIGMESNYDYKVKAKTSSASGWFQFINATWDEMVQRYGGKYDITNDSERSLRLDPRANALMGIEFTLSNQRYLKAKTNREPNLVETYLAHFLGAGTAVKFMLADQDALGKDLFPREAKSNPAVFYQGREPRTISDIITYFNKRLETTVKKVAEVIKTKQSLTR